MYTFLYICELNMQEMSVISKHPIFIGFRRLTGFQLDPRDSGVIDRTLPRPYLNSCLEDPARHFNGLLETDSSDRRNPRSEP